MLTILKKRQDQQNGLPKIILFIAAAFYGVFVFATDGVTKYEISSESVTLKRNDGTQSDLKMLLGYEVNPWDGLYSRFSLGGYTQGQYSKEFGTSRKTGPVFQIKQNIYKQVLFFSYEYFSYTLAEQKKYENKVGFLGGTSFRFSQRVSLDSYMESFMIREVSEKDLLTAARASLLIDSGKTEYPDQVDGLIEVYHKSGPENWGGSYSDLRLGFRVQPWSFLSFKVYSPILTTQTEKTSYLEGQLNIVYGGIL
ncbi:MAG: hypothetical protein IPK04_03295 [Bdellovibrionales bacterium]|nr:hypothetical protein [Bdellovibrionales bacterium]